MEDKRIDDQNRPEAAELDSAAKGAERAESFEPEEKTPSRPQMEDAFGGNEPVDETGVIAANTKITGDIVTRGHLIINGEVEGNIKAAGNITATGRLLGDVTCENLKLTGCAAQSNLTVRGTIIMDESARVEGEIRCRAISADGFVKGNIEAASEVSVHSHASIVGGIRTKSLSVDAGAQLQGSINVVK